MADNINFSKDSDKKIDSFQLFLRFMSFWKFYLISFVLLTFLAFLTIRYSVYQFKSQGIVEIVDKAQDSEMSLPTAMTIFNRSMINLENEIGVFKSYELHKRTVLNSKFNIKYFSEGRVKATENHNSEFFDDYDLNFIINPDTISIVNTFKLNFENNILKIEHYIDEKLVYKNEFSGYSTIYSDHELPFNISVRDNLNENVKKVIKIIPTRVLVEECLNAVQISPRSGKSDQLLISLTYPNSLIAAEYVNKLISEYDSDGIRDRQLVYKRTIDFVDSRFDFLYNELNEIEDKKQDFKEVNNIIDISSDANLSAVQKISYDSELFEVKSQLELCELLQKEFNNELYNLVPIDIGLDNLSITNIINDYNILISKRDAIIMAGAGENNPKLVSLNKQIQSTFTNLSMSVNRYIESLKISISNLESKEIEYESFYRNIPKNEKVLRSIERELEVKEALFLLLLQKREEAAINFAVVKPTIKLIDKARASIIPISPKKTEILIIYTILSLIIPTILIAIWFTFDNKIHNRDHINKIINDKISIVGEIPFIANKINFSHNNETSRDILSESIRMIIANLNFILFNNEGNKRNNIILTTSSIKGEGKTIVSTNFASILSSKFSKVLLIGADLRNPQIHKLIGSEKNTKGLTDLLVNENLNYKDHLIKKNNLDILLSGPIPPNPTVMLSSKAFKDLIKKVSSDYDYVVIDSAPCLLVADTFEISEYVDTCLYLVKANHTPKKLLEFINENYLSGKFKSLNIVLNGVGSEDLYGYNYSYNYSYKYGYNYGYTYNYGEKK